MSWRWALLLWVNTSISVFSVVPVEEEDNIKTGLTLTRHSEASWVYNNVWADIKLVPLTDRVNKMWLKCFTCLSLSYFNFVKLSTSTPLHPRGKYYILLHYICRTALVPLQITVVHPRKDLNTSSMTVILIFIAVVYQLTKALYGLF